MLMLDVTGLHSGYGSTEIISGLSFQIKDGSLTGILGVNGSGKSTLLKTLCGGLPYRGKILLLGQDVKKCSSRDRARFSRYIPQRSGIALDITVLDVVLMGFNPLLGLLESPTSAMQQQAQETLDAVGIGSLSKTNFQTLSEGQKQLCILARAMLLEKGVLFLDEPESALDFSGRYKMLGLLRRWLNGENRAALVTLHDPQLALNTCDTLLLLQDGTLKGTLHPGSDSLEDLEMQLTCLYGNLSIHRCITRNGKQQYVLLKEE